MTKVCFVVSSLCNEGPVNVMYNIIRYMDFSVFEVSIITLIPEKENSRFYDFCKLPIKIHQIFSQEKKSLFAMYKPLKKIMEEINPNIIHAHCPRSLYLMSFLPNKYKKIYTIHIYPGLQQHILYGKFKGEIIIHLNHFFTKRIDLPIGCAESISELYKKNKGWNIPAIPNGCSLQLWDKNEQERKRLRNKLGLKNDILYFIFIGRFSKEKNPDFLVRSFQELKGNIGIILLGTGPLWEQIKKYENEKIIIPGFKNNIYEYLIAADYYISASDVEGLANTILESMTVGLPMLLSDIPSHREILQKMDTCVGYIYNHHNKEDLYTHIDKILSLNKDQVSKEIRSKFNQYYTAKQMSLKYQETYLSLN